MSIEFDEDQQQYRNRDLSYESSGWITKLFIKTGLAKNKSAANIPMIIVAIICLGLSIYFFTKI